MSQTILDPAAKEQIDHIEDLLRGLETDTPAAAAYAAKLQEIKHRFNAYMSFYHQDTEKKQTTLQVKHLVIMGALFLLYIVAFFVLREKTNFQIAVAIAVCIAAGVTKKNGLWGVLPAVAFVIGAFIEKTALFIPLFIVVYAVTELMALTKIKGGQRQLEGEVDRLLALQNEMTSLIPALKTETAAWQKSWLAQNADKYDASCLLDLEDPSVFPTFFWWQITPDKLIDLEQQELCCRIGEWETKAVSRTNDTAFDTQDEYSPLYDLEMSNAITEGTRMHDLVVYDIVSRVLQMSASAKQYEVPAHDSMAVFSRYTALHYICQAIDENYKKGEIDEKTMAENWNMASVMLMNTMDYASATKVKTEHIPIHEHQNIWTGQIVLQPFEEEGLSGYSLVQYCCQPPHMTENLKAIAGLPIVYIHYTLADSNPLFLAAFYATFPDCT